MVEIEKCAAGDEGVSAHTPGPWTRERSWDGHPVGHLVGANGEDVVVSNSGLSFGSSVHFPSGEANARLIAAAPDLLEVVKILRKYLSLFRSDSDDVARVIFDVADAAIARATGEIP